MLQQQPNNHLDESASAEFEKSLSSKDITRVIKLVINTVESEQASLARFSGFTSLEVNSMSIHIGLRYSIKADEISQLSQQERDELPRRIGRFTSHLFAIIDSNFTLVKCTLPDSFRFYVDLSDE